MIIFFLSFTQSFFFNLIRELNFVRFFVLCLTIKFIFVMFL